MYTPWFAAPKKRAKRMAHVEDLKIAVQLTWRTVVLQLLLCTLGGFAGTALAFWLFTR